MGTGSAAQPCLIQEPVLWKHGPTWAARALESEQRQVETGGSQVPGAGGGRVSGQSRERAVRGGVYAVSLWAFTLQVFQLLWVFENI